MLFALIFPRAQRASTYDISAERNVWLQSALRSFAVVCDYMETGLFAIVCDVRSAIRDRQRSSAIVCDHMETSLNLLGDKTTTVIMSREQKIKEGQILLNDLDNYRPLEKQMADETVEKKKNN